MHTALKHKSSLPAIKVAFEMHHHNFSTTQTILGAVIMCVVIASPNMNNTHLYNPPKTDNHFMHFPTALVGTWTCIMYCLAQASRYLVASGYSS